MEVIIKPEQINLDDYIKNNINNFLLPLENYAVEYNNFFTLNEIIEIKEKYKNINIFVSINKNIFNDELTELKKILIELDKIKVKAIFYYDLSLIKLKKELNLNIDLVWNQTHMVTNYKTCNYYNDLGVKYALISKEITKDEILEIINKSKIIPIVELISYPSIAFSKRKLITNYYKSLEKEKNDNLIIHEKVSEDDYKLIEDRNGTTFIKNELLNGTFILEELLNNKLQYILLKEDFVEHTKFLQVINNINYFINNYKVMSKDDKDNWLKEQEIMLGNNTGFFFKKTIYKVK